MMTIDAQHLVITGKVQGAAAFSVELKGAPRARKFAVAVRW